MYYLKALILVAFLLAGTFSYADSNIDSSVNQSQDTSVVEYADSEGSETSDDAPAAVCQSDSNYPCCCKLGGSRSCTTKSECANNGGKCTTKDPQGVCP